MQTQYNQDYNNKVVLIGHYGGDKTHALSAWQSTGFDDIYEDLIDSPYNESYIDQLFENTKSQKKKSVEELLLFLAKNNHHTPFEKSTLHFQVRSDTATHIQFLKHRIGVSINTESARYKELEDKFYLPCDWMEFDGLMLDLTDFVDNPLEKVEGDIITVLTWFAELGHELYHRACKELTPIVGRQRAKETSRYFLPYCKQVDFDVMFNFRSFMHFQALRNSKHAQKEIKYIAEKMLYLVSTIKGNPFDLSLKAFNVNIKE